MQGRKIKPSRHSYHFLMLSFGVIIWCYYLFNVIIWCYHFSQFANVIIFVLSFFLIQHGCYHLCYHLMLSFPPLFSFSWKCDTLHIFLSKHLMKCWMVQYDGLFLYFKKSSLLCITFFQSFENFIYQDFKENSFETVAETG